MASTALGDLIRDLRCIHGWSQGRLADKLCETAKHSTVSREEVSKWERGVRPVGPFWLRHLATVLEVPLQVLEDAKVKRRRFLTNVAATAIAPVVASDLLREGFDAALAGRPGLDQWAETIEDYGRAYMSQGAEEIQKRLALDMVILQQGLEDPRMWDVAAKLMVLFGKTFPGSDGTKAVSWYRTAVQAADRSGIEDARVWVRGRASLALAYEGASLPIATMLAKEALAISELSSPGRLNALWAMAHVSAQLGDREGANAYLLSSRREFEASGAEEKTDYAIPWWRHNVHISLLGARLGDEQLAAQGQADGLASIPAELPRFKTHLEMHQGLMQAKAGDKTGGIATARSALDKLPPEKHSLTLRLLMSEVEAA